MNKDKFAELYDMRVNYVESIDKTYIELDMQDGDVLGNAIDELANTFDMPRPYVDPQHLAVVYGSVQLVVSGDKRDDFNL